MKNQIRSPFSEYGTEPALQELEAGKIRAIITSPEMIFQHPTFSQLIRRAEWMKNVLGTVIDEAHCVLEWGKEFRRDFDDLEKTRTYMSHKPLFFCTATLTPDMLHRLQLKLGFDRQRKFILNLGNERHNITPIVCRLKGPKDFEALDFLLNEPLALPPQPLIPTLVYAEIRQTVRAAWHYLVKKLPPSSHYRSQVEFLYSSRSDTVKALVLSSLLRGHIKVLISTEAAGMVLLLLITRRTSLTDAFLLTGIGRSSTPSRAVWNHTIAIRATTAQRSSWTRWSSSVFTIISRTIRAPGGSAQETSTD